MTLTIPDVSVADYEIAGLMGRAYLTLPCGHHRASLPDPVVGARLSYRTSRTCRRRYEIVIRPESHTAQIRKLRRGAW